MNAAHLIEQVRHAGGTIRADGGKLKLTAPRPLAPDLVETLKAHKAEVLATLIASRYGLTLADLKAVAGPDWPEVQHNPALLDTLARALTTRRLREKGEVPAHYTAVTVCEHCGPVPIFQGVPEKVAGCPWCFNRLTGKPLPEKRP